MVVSVTILDNEEWNPDTTFEVELYDPDSKDATAYEEYDTKTTIQIIDDDQPGFLGFEETQITVMANREYVEVNVERFDGSEGQVSCVVRTLDAGMTARGKNAIVGAFAAAN